MARQTGRVTRLRDENKAKRHEAILDAAISLLGTRSSEDITTEEIAAAAGVASATVYNLVGTRTDLMHAAAQRLLRQLSDSIDALEPTDPIAVATLVIDQAVESLVSNSAAYRQVAAIAHSAYATKKGIDPSNFQVEAMRRAQAMGIIRDDIDADGLGRQIFLGYIGAMMHWSAGRLDDAGFLIAARHGLATALAAAATDEHRDEFVDRMRPLSVALERNAWKRHPTR